MKAWAYGLSGLLLAGGTAIAADRPDPPTAKAVLHNAKGETVGEARLVEGPHGVIISLTARQLPPGTHGFHIHEHGHCEGPTFASAGGHFNPDGHKHGFMNPAGPHAGDLPNITVAADGTVAVDVLAPKVTLKAGKYSLLKAGGTTLMIHAGPDDYKTDPAGDSGARIACGTIEAVR